MAYGERLERYCDMIESAAKRFAVPCHLDVEDLVQDACMILAQFDETLENRLGPDEASRVLNDDHLFEVYLQKEVHHRLLRAKDRIRAKCRDFRLTEQGWFDRMSPSEEPVDESPTPIEAYLLEEERDRVDRYVDELFQRLEVDEKLMLSEQVWPRYLTDQEWCDYGYPYAMPTGQGSVRHRVLHKDFGWSRYEIRTLQRKVQKKALQLAQEWGWDDFLGAMST